MIRRLALLSTFLFAAAAAPAHAGTYAVNFCGSYGNHSWTGVAVTGISRDVSCAGSDPMGNRVAGGARVPDSATASTTFTAPAGMTIADFTLTRQLTYRNGPPADGTRPLYALYRLGGTVFAGAGRYQDATRDRLHAQGSWYGYPENNVVVPRSTVSRASFPALAGYAGDATSLQIVVGCYNGPRNTACTTAGGGEIANLISGVQVVLDDPTLPSASVEATGLLAGGRHDGSEAITLNAGDNGGIKRVQVLDLSNGGAVVGQEDYAAGSRTDKGSTCSTRLKKQCPTLRNETIRPTSLPAGQRTLAVRVFDAAENSVDQGPYVVDVATPSDRGPLNGSGATDGGTLSAHFSGGNHKHKTVGYRSRATVTGRLLNSAGHPVSGAVLQINTRDRRSGARFVQRYTAKTSSSGLYKVKVRAAASRLVQVAWASHIHDPSPQESAYVTLNARASASLHAKPRVVGVGQSLKLYGTVRGAIPSRGVPVIFQGRPGGGHYETFADGRADRRGRFRVHYRFRSGSSHGRTFTFRVKLRGDSRFPYALGYSKRVRVRVR
jgi:hypothetical protein